MDAQTAALYRTLAKELAQPGETLLQTRVERDAVPARARRSTWLVVVITLAFAAANLLSAWYFDRLYDWGFSGRPSPSCCCSKGCYSGLSHARPAPDAWARLLSATLDPPRLTARALCIGALTGDDALAPPLIPPLAPTEETLATQRRARHRNGRAA